MNEPNQDLTFLFSDIEGSTRLWEQQPERMQRALAGHDALARACVAAAGGEVVKSTGDGIHAVFADAPAALSAALQLQRALADPAATQGLPLRIRCGLHLGRPERRDGDYFGPAVNRAARIMSIAHGGQTLLSEALVDRLAGRWPPGTDLLDLGRVRLRDLSEPERVYQLLHAGLRAEFPPLRSLESTPNNLAQQLNSFVGREREMAELRAKLATSRLLTLLGMGGIGKSRLSVQLGAEVMDDYPDGVWLVELAPLTDAQRVPQALASVLGLKEDAGQTLAQALARYVADKQLLLILDNCEHVVHACAELAKQLLQAGARVTVLASSRDPLQVAGETIYPLPTLAVPEPGRATDPDTLMRHEAVRLFVDRASAVQPGFAVTAQNAAAVADICQRLDGIPLAIELAAARTRALSVQAIAARLGDRFRLLVSGDRTVLPRQRTLRALIDWSHDLLAAPEQQLFHRLAIFAGGWTLEAAEAVCAGDGLDGADVLDLLARLVEKSLVLMEADGARYRLLDTVRHYALERLAASAGQPALRARHLQFFLALAEQARAGLQGAEQGLWLTRLDAERDNLLAAHGGCVGTERADCESGLRLVYALRPYWLNRGLLDLGYQVTVQALQREAAQPRDRARAMGLADAGRLAYFMGRYAQARQYLEQSLAIARELGEQRLVALVLQPLGIACEGEGDIAAARQHLEEAVALARAFGNPRELAAALNALAQLQRAQGRLDAAEPLYRDALALSRELGDQGSIAVVLLNRAMVSVGRRPLAEVAPWLLEAMAIAGDIGSNPALQGALEVCAGLAADCGDAVLAARLSGVADALATQSGLRRDPADEAFLRPRVEQARRALGDADFDRHATAGRQLGAEAALAQARAWLAGGAPPAAGISRS